MEYNYTGQIEHESLIDQLQKKTESQADKFKKPPVYRNNSLKRVNNRISHGFLFNEKRMLNTDKFFQ